MITPYRQQIKLLTGLFVDLPRVEILTADKSQGRDKDCVLISLVRSNEVGYVSRPSLILISVSVPKGGVAWWMDSPDADIAQIGDLLRDWRRINVSFTRAKRKLVIFGSRNTLASDCLLAGFLRLMDSKSWIYALPKGADELHPLFNDLESETMCMKGKGVVKQEGEDRGGKGERKVGRAAEGILNGRPFGKEVLEVSCVFTSRLRNGADKVKGDTRECIWRACLILPLKSPLALTRLLSIGGVRPSCMIQSLTASLGAGTIRSFLLACTIGVVAMSRAMHIVQIGTKLIVDRQCLRVFGAKASSMST